MKRPLTASLLLCALIAGPATAEVSCDLWSSNQKRFFTDAGAQDVARCISSGAKVRTSGRNGLTALHSAAAYTTDSKVISLILDAGAYLEAISADGYTPLHVTAVLNTNPAIVTALLDAGANLEARTRSGSTPLLLAAKRSRSPEVVLTLIEAGANLDATDKKWATPARHARYNRALRGSRAGDVLTAHRQQTRRGATTTTTTRSAPDTQQREAVRKRRAEAAERHRVAEAQRRTKEEEERRLALEKQRTERREREQRRLDVLEKRAIQVETDRQQCEPKLEAAGFIGSLLNKTDVIEDLKGFQLPSAPSYAAAIPFLLAGPEKHSDVYTSVYERILNQIDAIFQAQIDGHKPEPYLDDWFESVSSFKDNCLFNLADYLLLNIMQYDNPSIRIALGYRDNNLTEATHVRAHALVEAIPPALLKHIDDEREFPTTSETFRKLAELVKQHQRKDFVDNTCLSYFAEQSKLQKGEELNDIQRKEMTLLCNCFYDGVSDPEDFVLIFSMKHALSKRRLDAVQVLGNCAIKHGLNKKQ